MKRTSYLLGVLLIILVLLSSASFAKEVNWKMFADNLAVAMRSDNRGLQQSAMCMMIQYSDFLQMDRATVFDIVRIFRDDKDENVRLLAMVTLYKIEDPWAMDFLKRHRNFEEQSRIQKLCCCAVRSYYAKLDSIKTKTTDDILAKAEEDVVSQFSSAAGDYFQLDEYGL